jgi:hypothetical protein
MSSSTGSGRSSHFRRNIARVYLRQTPRYRIFLTLLFTLVIIGAEVWAIGTWLQGRKPYAEGVYAVEEHQGWINMAVFVVGFGGVLGVTVLIVKGLTRSWAKWDRIVAQGLRVKSRSTKARSDRWSA